MRVLIVLAHPLPDSLCASLAKTAREALQGHEIRFSDLYASGFDPRLSASERASYHGTYERAALTDEIADLEWADMLVLVFPTWWFGFPAILKGWFDRVWAPGVAFEHAPDLSAIRPKLNLQKVVAITTLGSPWWADRALLRPVRRVLKTEILKACAPQAKLTYLPIYRAEALGPRAVAIARARIVKALS